MKTVWFSAILAVWAGAGCVTLPVLWAPPKPEPTPAAQPARPKPPVTAEQITEDNAHEKAKALLEELDREATDATPPAAKPEPARKP
jgi:hypothetical protein